MESVPKVFFILGGPGSGKGTYCTKLSNEKGFPHFSAGDLLREERDSGSELAATINENISQGKLVPSEITVQLLRNAIDKSAVKTILIDGFPRS
jgi:UMP-CMP kinase